VRRRRLKKQRAVEPSSQTFEAGVGPWPKAEDRPYALYARGLSPRIVYFQAAPGTERKAERTELAVLTADGGYTTFAVASDSVIRTWRDRPCPRGASPLPVSTCRLAVAPAQGNAGAIAYRRDGASVYPLTVILTGVRTLRRIGHAAAAWFARA
jgi:hypothetical protein